GEDARSHVDPGEPAGIANLGIALVRALDPAARDEAEHHDGQSDIEKVTPAPEEHLREILPSGTSSTRSSVDGLRLTCGDFFTQRERIARAASFHPHRGPVPCLTSHNDSPCQTFSASSAATRRTP